VNEFLITSSSSAAAVASNGHGDHVSKRPWTNDKIITEDWRHPTDERTDAEMTTSSIAQPAPWRHRWYPIIPCPRIALVFETAVLWQDRSQTSLALGFDLIFLVLLWLLTFWFCLHHGGLRCRAERKPSIESLFHAFIADIPWPGPSTVIARQFSRVRRNGQLKNKLADCRQRPVMLRGRPGSVRSARVM